MTTVAAPDNFPGL